MTTFTEAMKNFKYENGDEVEFNGFFGTVKIMFRIEPYSTAEHWQNAQFKDGRYELETTLGYSLIVELYNKDSKFLTRVMVDGKECSAENAVKELYTEYAASKAARDCNAT